MESDTNRGDAEVERIEHKMNPVATAEAEYAGPDRKPKEFRLYLSDDEACLRIRVPYEGMVTHTTQDRGTKFVNSNKGYLRRSRDNLTREEVIDEFEERTGEKLPSFEQRQDLGKIRKKTKKMSENWEYIGSSEYSKGERYQNDCGLWLVVRGCKVVTWVGNFHFAVKGTKELIGEFEDEKSAQEAAFDWMEKNPEPWDDERPVETGTEGGTERRER
jgi:hypothetical protein